MTLFVYQRMVRGCIGLIKHKAKYITYHFELGLIRQLCLTVLRLALMSFHDLLQIPINTLATISLSTTTCVKVSGVKCCVDAETVLC